MRPLFSVIIPTYNRAALLKMAIKSILDQTFNDFELIVVDDGSTDNTKEIVQTFEDKRVQYVFQKNADLSAARNTGVRNAKGQYVSFLDDDDEYLKGHLQALLSGLEPDKKAVYRTSLMIRNSDLREGSEEKGIEWNGVRSPLEFVWNGFVGITTFCFPISLFNTYHFPEKFILFEDKHFLARVLLEYEMIQIKDAPTVVYNIYENSRSFTAYLDDKRLTNQVECVQDVFRTHGAALKKVLGDTSLNRKCSDFYYQAAQQALRNGDKSFVVKRLKQANQYDSSFVRKLKYLKVWIKSWV